jgi:hypothetical protein
MDELSFAFGDNCIAKFIGDTVIQYHQLHGKLNHCLKGS